MPKYAGPKNIVLMDKKGEKGAVSCEYEHASGLYVVTLSDADAKLYGAALLHEGMSVVDDASDESDD